MTTALLATGGTICWHDQDKRFLSAADLASSAQLEFDSVLDVEAVPSWDLGIADMQGIALAVSNAIDGGADVVVVTHGTDTLEETAWLTDLLLGAERRRAAAVVFTGSMRFASHPSADGPTNIREALLHGQRGAGHDSGVQVSFAGRVHSARWARKVTAARLDPFESGGRPPNAACPPEAGESIEPNVALLKLGAVARPKLPTGMKGVVLEGTGASHVPSEYHDSLRGIAESGVPVVLATRVDDTPRPARSAPWLYACDLTPEKAAIALRVALGAATGKGEVDDWWERLMTGAVFVGPGVA